MNLTKFVYSVLIHGIGKLMSEKDKIAARKRNFKTYKRLSKNKQRVQKSTFDKKLIYFTLHFLDL